MPPHRDRAPADTHKLAGGMIQSLIPANFMPLIAPADHRQAQTVRVFMKVLQRRGFGADVTLTERVILIAFNRKNLAIFMPDFNATGRLTQAAGAFMRLNSHYFFPGC